MLSLLPLSLFGCALCTLYTPTAHTTLSYEINQDKLEAITFTWNFSENFSKQLYDSYDEDGNGDFNKEELKAIKQTLVDYVEPKHYLTQLSFYDQPEGENQRIAIQIESNALHVKDKSLTFEYRVPVFIPLKEGRVLIIRMEDNEEFFNFKILAKSVALTDTLWMNVNINNQIGYFEMGKKPAKTMEKRPKLTTLVSPQKPKKEETSNLPEQPSYQLLASWMADLTKEIKALLQATSKEGMSLALLNLLGISFLYGLIHAAGPGHGKTLVGSYFVSTGGSWKRALLMALRIGIVHVTGAALLVALSKFGIEMFIGKVLADTTLYTTRLAAIIILAIAAWLFYKKLRKPNHHEHSCHCNSCSHTPKGSDWGMAIAAGMIPCPGTVVIFILTFTFGTYLTGFLSALAMALGMSTVIFLTSLLGQRIHASSKNYMSYFLTFIEYLSLIILAILGTLMFFSASSF